MPTEVWSAPGSHRRLVEPARRAAAPATADVETQSQSQRSRRRERRRRSVAERTHAVVGFGVFGSSLVRALEDGDKDCGVRSPLSSRWWCLRGGAPPSSARDGTRAAHCDWADRGP